MPTVYPDSIDNFTNPTATDETDVLSHADQHSSANDAVEAIETVLGVNPQGAFTTVADRIEVLEDLVGL